MGGMMKTVVVTGAGGFVGRAVVKQLLSNGVNVISVIHSDNVPAELNGSTVIKADMADYLNLKDELIRFSPDTFYHFSWAGTSGALRADEKIQLANVKGSCDAVRLASFINCKRFIFASSIMEYEVDVKIKNMESPGINMIYSTAKMAADYMARIIASDLKIEFVSALISNIYGPGEKTPRLINSSIRTLLAGKRLSLSPCTHNYDFIYISDAAKMFLEIGTKGSAGRTYYIGNRQVRKLKEFMEELRDIVSPGAELGFGDISTSGTNLDYSEFDKELLYQDTGCVPEVSFKEGIELTMDWIKEEDGFS
jgi:nucleoside-diphosphate-sugar epimerase